MHLFDTTLFSVLATTRGEDGKLNFDPTPFSQPMAARLLELFYVEVLGQGGQGTVYLCRDKQRLYEEVAVKVTYKSNPANTHLVRA